MAFRILRKHDDLFTSLWYNEENKYYIVFARIVNIEKRNMVSDNQFQYTNVPPKKYIILDWNVIKYLKNPRLGKDEDCILKDTIKRLRKKYYFPFCESHLRDLKQSVKQGFEDKIYSDLDFLKDISESVGLLPDRTMKTLAKYSVREYFDILLKEIPPAIKLTPKPLATRVVDMEKLETDNPLKPLLDRTGGILSPISFYEWLNEMFITFFDDPDVYRKMRSYVNKIYKDLCSCDTTEPYGRQLIECSTPFFESIDIQNKEELSLVWNNVVDSWLRMNFHESEPNPLEALSVSYALLDMHPLFQEKMNSKNKLDNMVRDSKLICYASSSEYLITEDKKCYEKAKFIYNVYGYTTKVIKINEFLYRFS